MAQLTVSTAGVESRVQRFYTVTLHVIPKLAPTAIGDALAAVTGPESITRTVSLWYTEEEAQALSPMELAAKLEATKRLRKLLAKEVAFPFDVDDWEVALDRESLVKRNVERAETGRVISCRPVRSGR